MQEKLEKRLADYIAIATLTQNTRECRRFITQLAVESTRLGLYTYVRDGIHPSVVITTTPTKHPKIMIVTHADVVPSSDNSLFMMKATKEKLYGRGVYDMKFAIATTMEFFATHRTSLKKFDIGLMVTTDEETGGTHGAATLLEEGWRADVAVVPDGGEDWKIEARAKGRKQIRLIATGVSSHGSRPWEGDNAINKLVDALARIKRTFPSADMNGVTASINTATGGNAGNQVPDHAEAFIDLRGFEDKEIIKAQNKLVAIAEKAGIQAVEAGSHRPLRNRPHDPYVRHFAAVYEQVMKKKLQTVDSYGATDGAWCAEYDIPCIVIRPRGGAAHSAGEWLNRKDLVRFYTLMESFLMQAGENVTPGTTRPVENLVDSLSNR